jgi:hypothetical protein
MDCHNLIGRERDQTFGPTKKGERMEKTTKKLDTTLGELIAAASEVAFEYSDNDRDAYKLAQAALIEILRKASHSGELDNFGLTPPGKTYLH